MDHQHSPLPMLASPGATTSFYAYEGGAARNAVLAALALQLAGADAAAPVLVVDWDLAAPALHRHFPLPPAALPAQAVARAGDDDSTDAGRPGLVELLEACRAGLRGAPWRGEELAERVLDGVGWQAYIERVDGRRPLYLLRAGRFDDSYAQRAGRLDLEALFDACPALFRCLAARLNRHFGHVLIAAGAGRSAAVSVCTTLLPDRLVGLFSPAPGSIEGLDGVLRRAIDYRCTHEEEQRPLLLYPLACSADGARSDPHARWRRGDARHGLPGYQPRLEALLRASYGWSRLNLDNWFDETQLALADALSTAGPAGDRRALARHAALLAEWLAPAHFPWQSLTEVRLRAALARARLLAGASADADAGDAGDATDAGHVDDAGALALAGHLAQLGALCRRERCHGEALACLQECLALRERLLGGNHGATRSARAALAAHLFDSGAAQDARHHGDLLVQACTRAVGPDAPETLAARSQLARALALLCEGERALALHEQVVAACERALGELHPATLDCLEDQAHSLVQQREFERAGILYERVLDARRRGQGSEHGDTLRCAQRLALLLGETGELGNARRMLESVLRAHERQDGPDAAGTVSAREALAEILAAQGDLAAVRSIQESLAYTRERFLGAGHPETLTMQLRLASTLGLQGEADAARRLREQVAQLRQHLRDVESLPPYGMTESDDTRSAAPALDLAPRAAAMGASSMGAVSAGADVWRAWHDDPLARGQDHRARGPYGDRAPGAVDHLAPDAVDHPVTDDDDDLAPREYEHLAPFGYEHRAARQHADAGQAFDHLGRQLAQLQSLIDSRSPGEARALADSLRTWVLGPSANHRLRRRGAAMIKQVYLQEGDKDALLSFTQDEVSLLEGALIEAAREHPMELR